MFSPICKVLPGATHVYGVYIYPIAAVLWLQYMVYLLLCPVTNGCYSYISTFRSTYGYCPIWLFSVVLWCRWFPELPLMLLDTTFTSTLQMRYIPIAGYFYFKIFRLFISFFLLYYYYHYFARLFWILLEFELFLVISGTPLCLLVTAITLFQLGVFLLLTVWAKTFDIFRKPINSSKQILH